MWVQHFRVLSYNHRIGSGPPGSRLPYFYELHHLIATSLHPGGPDIQSWFADKTPFKIPNEAGVLRQVLTLQEFQPHQTQLCSGQKTNVFGENCVHTLNLLASHAHGFLMGQAYVSARGYATWVRTGNWEMYLYQS